MNNNSLIDIKMRITSLKEKTCELKKKYNLNIGKYYYDPDSSPNAWKYFWDVYNDVLSCDTENKNNLFSENYEGSLFWKAGKDYIRVVGTFEYGQDKQVTLSKNKKLIVGENIGIAGDCVFNFNELKRASFWNKIVAKSELKESEKEIVRNILDLCLDMHHSFYNFSLMPRNGGLQAVKGCSEKYDRPDVFLYKLRDYYQSVEPKDKHVILKYSRGKNKDALVDFLDKIGSFKNYCKMFYHLDSKKEKDNNLLKDLLKKGDKPISKYEDLITYIELAVSYWEHQAEYYDIKTEREA